MFTRGDSHHAPPAGPTIRLWPDGLCVVDLGWFLRGIEADTASVLVGRSPETKAMADQFSRSDAWRRLVASGSASSGNFDFAQLRVDFSDGDQWATSLGVREVRSTDPAAARGEPTSEGRGWPDATGPGADAEQRTRDWNEVAAIFMQAASTLPDDGGDDGLVLEAAERMGIMPDQDAVSSLQRRVQRVRAEQSAAAEGRSLVPAGAVDMLVYVRTPGFYRVQDSGFMVLLWRDGLIWKSGMSVGTGEPYSLEAYGRISKAAANAVFARAEESPVFARPLTIASDIDAPLSALLLRTPRGWRSAFFDESRSSFRATIAGQPAGIWAGHWDVLRLWLAEAPALVVGDRIDVGDRDEILDQVLARLESERISRIDEPTGIIDRLQLPEPTAGR